MAKNISAHIHYTDPYEGLQILPLDEQGWNSTGTSFEACIRESNAKLIVEVGTWKGASAFYMAKVALNDLLFSREELEIVCIDTFLGSVEHLTTMATFQPGNGSKKNGRPTVYEQFLSNVIHKGYQDVITPFPVDSYNGALALKHWNIQADMIYIDAGHDYDSVYNDFKLYKDVLRVGGHMLVDDWHHGPIKEAAKEIFGNDMKDFHGKALWVK